MSGLTSEVVRRGTRKIQLSPPGLEKQSGRHTIDIESLDRARLREKNPSGYRYDRWIQGKSSAAC